MLNNAVAVLEASSFRLQARAWLAQVDSNHRPRAYQARALTTWAMSHCLFTRLKIGSRPVSGGGDDGIRTHDPLLAGQVLSQLSYTPIEWDSKLYIGFVSSTLTYPHESFVFGILLFSVFKDPQKLNKEV